MPRNIVLKDGVLSAEVVSYEQVELAQLEAEVASKQEAVNQVQAEADAVAARLNEAQSSLEDSKSEHQVASGLVETPAEAPAGEPVNDDGSVPVDVTVAGAAEEL